MGFVFPFARRVRYLSGLDWVIASLDRSMKARGSSGNSSQIVMVLSAVPDLAALQAGLAEFAGHYPVLNGRVARNWLNLAPYWKTDGKPAVPPFRVHHAADFPAGDAIAEAPKLDAIANAPFGSDYEHLSFDLVCGDDGKALFVMRFDHRLFDARGAGLFLEHLALFLAGDRKAPDPGVSQRNASPAWPDMGLRTDSAPAGLSGWISKLMAGRVVNRRIIALSGTPPRTAPEPWPAKPATGWLRQPSAAGARARFLLTAFDREATTKILDDAHARAGALMEMPYLLAVVTQALHAWFAKKGMPGDGYFVPVTVDTRSPRDPVAEVFFNYASFLFFRVVDGDIPDRSVLIGRIKGQMYEQIKEGFPAKLAEVNYLMRIVPLHVLSAFMNRFMGGKRWSFTFGYRGKPSYPASRFMGVPVSAVFHMPRVPVPPGLGVFVDVFDGRMNAVLSWHDGIMDDAEARALIRDIRERLAS